MRDALAKQERPILYSLCQWGEADVPTWGNGSGHSWRTTTDSRRKQFKDISICIPTSTDLHVAQWRIVKYIMNRNLFTLNSVNFWGRSDADMLEIGNGGMTLAEERTHFAFWAAMKSPLLIGTDLSVLRQPTVDILKNKYLLAFNQDDTIGEPAMPYKWGTNPDWTFDDLNPAEFWSGNSKQGVFVLVVNTADTHITKRLNYAEAPHLKDNANEAWSVIDAWTGASHGCFSGRGIHLDIEPHDTAVLIMKKDCFGQTAKDNGTFPQR
jgi:alpha-galactosidase